MIEQLKDASSLFGDPNHFSGGISLDSSLFSIAGVERYSAWLFELHCFAGLGLCFGSPAQLVKSPRYIYAQAISMAYEILT